ncbi:hypothetical protein ABH922_005205 [Rhodococcus sp. 27YEA15]
MLRVASRRGDCIPTRRRPELKAAYMRILFPDSGCRCALSRDVSYRGRTAFASSRLRGSVCSVADQDGCFGIVV